MATVKFSSTIKGGLPVDVEAWVYPAEPDVGIMSSYVDDICLYWAGSNRIIPEKILAQVSAREWEDITVEALDANQHRDPSI